VASSRQAAVNQAVQVCGSLLLLVAFVLATTGRLKSASVAYLTLNIIGATALAVTALVARQWGFLLLETVWAGVATAGLRRLMRRRRVPQDLTPPSRPPRPSGVP
jgi:hypothetical protein